MTIFHLFSLLGGLGLFLYGMYMMREHLVTAAGGRMQKLLEKVTATPLRGFLTGIGVTAAVQSSSAVLAILVSLTDTGILSLKQVVWVILGANIGTTVTCQMLAADFGDFAPLLAFLGILCLLCAKRKRYQYCGGVLAGAGVLFIGLNMMEEAMQPLGEIRCFQSMLEISAHPAVGILAGAVFTALIQSSSASVGILQMLAGNGLINLSQSIYIVFGQNMGTCVTAFLAATGAKRSAKQVAAVHLMVNIFGTVLFVIICNILPFTDWMIWLSPAEPAKQIANVHTVFNMVTSLMLLPFGSVLVRLSEEIMSVHKKLT